MTLSLFNIGRLMSMELNQIKNVISPCDAIFYRKNGI